MLKQQTNNRYANTTNIGRRIHPKMFIPMSFNFGRDFFI